MTNNPTLFKLLRSTNPIIAKKMVVFIIPEGQFTPEEIEILRKEDLDRQWLGKILLSRIFSPTTFALRAWKSYRLEKGKSWTQRRGYELKICSFSIYIERRDYSRASIALDSTRTATEVIFAFCFATPRAIMQRCCAVALT